MQRSKPYHDPVTLSDLRRQLADERAENQRLRVTINQLLAAQGELDDDTREMLTERGHLIAECQRLRPVFEAAKAWRLDEEAQGPVAAGQRPRKTFELLVALDDALDAERQARKS